MTRRIKILNGTQLVEFEIQTGQTVSFDLHSDSRTPPRHVAGAKLVDETGRTIHAEYVQAKGLFGTKLKTYRIDLLRRMHGGDKDTYKVANWISGLDLTESTSY